MLAEKLFLCCAGAVTQVCGNLMGAFCVFWGGAVVNILGGSRETHGDLEHHAYSQKNATLVTLVLHPLCECLLFMSLWFLWGPDWRPLVALGL